jgi:hypothetical protein
MVFCLQAPNANPVIWYIFLHSGRCSTGSWTMATAMTIGIPY